ncbi:MAG TPA: quinate 5-dehydrogenase, partial [Candidatus Wallbacteria bacterium]|nr:quinate 5-dehydrogenase [Candidatus Wallbacteria bacterium]
MKTLKVVSVSLGASDRDHEAQIELLGKKIHISRIGSDGDIQKARRLAASLDGRVDAMGLG